MVEEIKSDFGSDVQKLEELSATMETLKNESGSLKAAKEDLERKLDEADSELLSDDYLNFKDAKAKARLGGGKEKVADDEKAADFDLDRASNKEIVDHVKSQYGKSINEAFEKVNTRMNDVEKNLGSAFAHIDVTIAAMKHDDWDKNSDAIFKVAKTNPSWGAEKCYKQFKLEERQSIVEADEVKQKKEEEELKLQTEKGGAMPITTTTEKQLSPKDAAEVAYRKAFGNKE